jgi:hypothetical protein
MNTGDWIFYVITAMAGALMGGALVGWTIISSARSALNLTWKLAEETRGHVKEARLAAKDAHDLVAAYVKDRANGRWHEAPF